MYSQNTVSGYGSVMLNSTMLRLIVYWSTNSYSINLFLMISIYQKNFYWTSLKQEAQ